MADNKKSFVLYCDLVHTFDKLTDEEAGKLFKHLLSYVNDRSPESDRITEVMFEPIKQQLKRDLNKYELKRKQWSEAGKASANKRKQTSTDVESRSTDSTVSVNDNVTVNDSVIQNNNNGEENLHTPKGQENTTTEKVEAGNQSSPPKPVQPNLIGNGEHWRSKINSDTKMAFRKTLTGKFRHANEDEINESMFFNLPWFDLKFPDGGTKKNFTTHFQYYVESMKALPVVSRQTQKPYG